MPHDAAFWTFIATVGLFCATLATAAAALYQVYAARVEARVARTLEVCNQYDINPILDSALRRLAVAWRSGDIQKTPIDFRLDAATVLNYLDGIAVGIDQKLYIEAIVRDHIEPIVKHHYEQYLGENRQLRIDGLHLENYAALTKLYVRWTAVNVRFKAR